MNPVDYFDPAQDTESRALGKRLIPEISFWTQRASTQHGDSNYEYVYGGRLYKISPQPSWGYNVSVYTLPLRPLTAVWINGGKEVTEPVSYGNLEAATYTANEHALRYGAL